MLSNRPTTPAPTIHQSKYTHTPAMMHDYSSTLLPPRSLAVWINLPASSVRSNKNCAVVLFAPLGFLRSGPLNAT